ncbi:MAG TPA: hypothetical protein PKC43_11945 [Phycisphaerales bacterium]|nr:hypothetical protein [Phycisphaerales bacterium]HMP38143.1 hypothetical protein [Phycisphaerales bacterium]
MPGALFAVAVAVVAASSSAIGSGGAARGPDLDGARSALERWVDVRRTISREQSEWKLRRESLDDRIDLLRAEIEKLVSATKELDLRVTEAKQGGESARVESEALKGLATRLHDAVVSLETRTLGLLPRLPLPVQEKVSILSGRIPRPVAAAAGAEPPAPGAAGASEPQGSDAPAALAGDPQAAPEPRALVQQSLGERWQNVIGVLNEINRFNAEISRHVEIMPLPDGSSAEVTTVYAGLGCGFFITTGGGVAAVGSAGPQAWEWRVLDAAREPVAALIAVLANERPAMFVRVPVEID